jgi:hypothetical protein
VHALVLLAAGAGGDPSGELEEKHMAFIDSLIDRRKVVLGGAWKPPVAGFEGAYLLSCGSLAEARAIADSDPLARAKAVRPEVIEWELVAVDPDAVDRDSLLFP